MRLVAKTSTWALALLMLCGFDWPRTSERLVRELDQAALPRDHRDAIRRLAHSELGPEVFLRELQQADPWVRVDALAALSTRGVDEEVLRAALEDPSPDVRIAALHALAESKRGDALTWSVSRALGDEDTRVRVAGVELLALLTSDVLPALSETLRDPAVDVRVAAARVLGARPEPEALSSLLSAYPGALPELRVALLDALAPHGPDARVAALFVRALTDEDEQVLLAALRGFARNVAWPRKQVEALVASPAPEVAAAAQRLLASPQQPSPRPWLSALERTAIRTLHADEQAALLRELEHTLPPGEALASDALLEWLTHAPYALWAGIVELVERSGGTPRAEFVPLLLRVAAPAHAERLRLLARTRDPRANVALERALVDKDPALRAAAVAALAQTLDEATASRLAARLTDRDATRRAAIVDVLADGLPRLTLARAAQDQLCSALEDDLTREATPPRELEATTAASSPACERSSARARAEELATECGAISELTDETAAQAARAVRALAAVDAACARRLVLTALDDPRVGVRIAALRASVRDRSPRARVARRRLAEHPDVRVAVSAVSALALAQDAIPLAWADGLERLPWPLGPARAFALASSRDPAARAALSHLVRTSREPVTRANALAAQRARAVSTNGEPVLRGDATAAQRALAAACPRSRERTRDLPTLDCIAPTCAARVTSRAGTLPRALLLEDGRVLISFPDASGHVAWTDAPIISHLPAWIGAYVRE